MIISNKKGGFYYYLISLLKRLIVPTLFKGEGDCLFSLVRDGVAWVSLRLQGHVIIFIIFIINMTKYSFI